MTIIPMIAAAVLVLMCLFLVISPFFREDFNPLFRQTPKESEQVDRKALLSTLNEIEFDYKMDKISEEDYNKLTKQYEKLIAEQMLEVEQNAPASTHQAEADLLKEIELEIEQELAEKLKQKGGK